MKRLISLLVCASLATSPVLAASPVLASEAESESEPNGGIFEDVVEFVTEKAAEASKATQDAMNAAGETLGEFGTNVSEQIGTAVSDISDYFNGLGQNISDVAAQVAETAESISQDIADQSSSIADQALTSLDGAVNLVVDGAGNVVNRASEGVDEVTSSATEALDTITSKGAELIALTDAAIIGLNLTKPENIEKAHAAIDKAIENAYNKGLFGNDVSLESIQIVKDIIFGTAVYGYQYSHGNITLPEYATLMSEIIIKEGLPTGVGYVASKLPVPGAGNLAKEATAFLVKVAFGEGEEEVLYEDTESLSE